MHHLTDALLSKASIPRIPSPQTPPTPPSFTLFSALPTELRLKIWSCTLRPRILEISHPPLANTYQSRTSPPILLSICAESRLLALSCYTYLQLGRKPYASIPFSPSLDTVYISKLAPILQTHLPDLLYNLSTSPSRSVLRKLAIDLRVWNECCEQGLLGILGRMRGLREVDIVVEFGREFRGETAFLEAPEWRSDLRWVAEMAEREVCEEMGRVKGVVRREGAGRREVEVGVRCVLLTKGGE